MQFDRATGFLLPPSLDEWLPERHLARFVVEVIDWLDLSAMVKSYAAGRPRRWFWDWSMTFGGSLLVGLVALLG
jgi:hypothetical protein